MQWFIQKHDSYLSDFKYGQFLETSDLYLTHWIRYWGLQHWPNPLSHCFLGHYHLGSWDRLLAWAQAPDFFFPKCPFLWSSMPHRKPALEWLPHGSRSFLDSCPHGFHYILNQMYSSATWKRIWQIQSQSKLPGLVFLLNNIISEYSSKPT